MQLYYNHTRLICQKVVENQCRIAINGQAIWTALEQESWLTGKTIQFPTFDIILTRLIGLVPVSTNMIKI